MIVFVDPVCPTPYSAASLEVSGLGGTEATVIRIAERLDATVAQHCRVEQDGRYVPYASVRSATHVVVLRKPSIALEWHQRCANAKSYLWLHDLITPGSQHAQELSGLSGVLKDLGTVVVCVSAFHRQQALSALGWMGRQTRRVVAIYNPIADDLQPTDGGFDPHKLVFVSQPRKGLDFALQAFRYLQARDANYRLVIANPGYRSHVQASQPGVVWAGALPHALAINQMRNALCVFYPNFHYPETFGLVFAESNAVGTPVLTYDIGAAREVLQDARQLMTLDSSLARAWRWSRKVPRGWLRRKVIELGARKDAFENYARVLSDWSQGNRPVVTGRDEFRLDRVARRWTALLSNLDDLESNTDSVIVR